MRPALLSLIVVAALAVPAEAQQPTATGIYPSLTSFPRARHNNFPGSYPIVPPRNTPLDPAVVNFPFLANGRVYTMGQMHQTYGFVPFTTPMTYGNAFGGYSGGYHSAYPGGYSYNWRW